MGRVWSRARPACPPQFPVPACGMGVRAGPWSRLGPALLGSVVGVCFLRFFFSWVGLSRALWSLYSHPLSFRLGCWLFFFFSFFFFVVCVCMFRCPFSRWAAVPGLVLPVLAGWSPCASLGVLSSVPSGGGEFGPLWWCWRAVWWLWANFAPPPSPLCCFFLGGGAACASLCLSWAGARTGPHSVLSSALLLAVAFCLAVFRPHGTGGLCTRWARRPFLPV